MEPDVWKQVDNIAAVPGVERIAIMPDAHIGNGACVGSAILTRSIVIPAAVGVDIGCGMIAAPPVPRLAKLTSRRVRYNPDLTRASSSMAEQLTLNQPVLGSSPRGLTSEFRRPIDFRLTSCQWVSCLS